MIRTGLFGQSLTTREQQVLLLLAEEKRAKEIAHILDITVKTVEFHKGNIYRKLGIHKKAQAVQYGIEHKIVNLPTPLSV